MKIALLLSRIEQTGVTTHTLDLAQGLIDKGHDVCLITGGKIENATIRVDHFYNAFVDLGVTIKEFKTPKGSLPQKIMASFAVVYKVIRDIKKFDPDVIHSQSPYMTFIPWMMGKKFTTTIHILYLKKNFKFKNPQHLIAISQESYDFSKKVFEMAEENISLIHHGVSDRYAHPISDSEKSKLKDRLQISEDKLIIGFAGSISRRKGTDILVEAIKNLTSTTKARIHVVFLGGVTGSEEQLWLQGLIDDAEIGALMTWVPFEDPKPFYDIFDIFVLPSRMESFPLVTLEAMMSGCCPIRSNVEGAYEQIEDGITGLLFESENTAEFTNAIERLVLNDKLRLELANNAKAKALKEYTIPVMTEKTLAVYEKIRNH
jgi:glycosyltransferase involved in cell wall biosynthesis